MNTSRTTCIRVVAGMVSVVALLSGATSHRLIASSDTGSTDLPFPLVTRFENFGEKDGLPSHKVSCVIRASDGRLWLGTSNGLCVREADGGFRHYGTEDGLSHPMVLSMKEDPGTGDLWIATMQGLCRFSGGQFTVFTQTNSGLPNNVVYAVTIMDGTVWAATAAGAGSYDLKTRSWSIYDQNNTVMEEPWCYSVTSGDSVVYIGVWAGGVVEHDPKTGSFKAYRDPDGDFQFQLVRDSGPIADITSWVDYQDGVLWQGTYFGLARYDTREATWRTWVQDKTPLVSNFVNTLFARGRVAWVATDRGVSATDGTSWANYVVDDSGQGLVKIYRPGHEPETRAMATALADGFVMAVWVDDREAWFATSNGLSRGVFAVPTASPSVVSNP